MISKMYVTLIGALACLFFSWWLDVRGFRDKGNVAEAMEEGCGIRGAWVRSDQSPTLSQSDCSLDGCMQDPYTRCKGLNEIASQVNHHYSALSILFVNPQLTVVCTGKRSNERNYGTFACGTDGLFSALMTSSQPRMYTKLAVTGRRVLTSTEHPNRLIMWQKHEYTIRVAGAKKVSLLFCPKH